MGLCSPARAMATETSIQEARAGGASKHVAKTQANKTKPLGSAAWLLDAPNW